MKARVNAQCAGSGVCADICPQVFEIAPTGLARVKVDVVPDTAVAACRQAREECPLQAIEIEE